MTLKELQQKIVECRQCPRLVKHREQIAREKRRAFRDWNYWGKPIPSLGSNEARLLILGLAPAAHGANRTGRMFTGDRSGDFLFETLHRFGFSTQPSSQHRSDGLKLLDTYITAALHCAPPANKPLSEELGNCSLFLKDELQLLKKVSVVVVLGQIAWKTYLSLRLTLGMNVPRPRPKFKHGAAHRLDNQTTTIISYHPSQQNTQTGRLTREMFDSVFEQARRILTD